MSAPFPLEVLETSITHPILPLEGSSILTIKSMYSLKYQVEIGTPTGALVFEVPTCDSSYLVSLSSSIPDMMI